MPQALTAIGVLAALLLLQLVLSAAGDARKDAEIQAWRQTAERNARYSAAAEERGVPTWVVALEDDGEPWLFEEAPSRDTRNAEPREEQPGRTHKLFPPDGGDEENFQWQRRLH